MPFITIHYNTKQFTSKIIEQYNNNYLWQTLSSNEIKPHEIVNLINNPETELFTRIPLYKKHEK